MTPRQQATIQRMQQVASRYCGTVYAQLVWGEAEELTDGVILIQGSNAATCPWYDSSICITAIIGPKGGIKSYSRFDNIPRSLFS